MTDYDDIVRRIIEAAGHATQSAGVGRVLGQIFAYLYFCPDPRSLDDLTAALGISKGSASLGVRQLEQWGGLEKIWIKGDRKDYYIAKDRFGRIIKNAVKELTGKKISSSSTLLKEAHEEMRKKLDGNGQTEEDQFLVGRIEQLQSFQEQAQGMWDNFIVKMLLQ